MKMSKELLNKRLEELHKLYDESECLIGEIKDGDLCGYHSRKMGRVHGTNKSAEYAAAIFYTGEKKYYARAQRVFERLAELQDTDPQSKTFGLWAYYAEESLKDMKAPDYNFADFIGKHFIYVLDRHERELNAHTAEIMRTALKNAVTCSIKRNVSPDYSNISMMSCMTIISAGEILNDSDIKAIGKKRLKKAYEYNMYSNAFSEYNSSTYTPLAIAELTRMMMYFKDEECLKMAHELHDLAWENISSYYSDQIGELAPPQKRCYYDIDDGQLGAFIYLATDGRFGTIDRADKLVLSYLMLPISCPEKYIGNFSKNGFIKKRYYRKNGIRTPDEDTVIIRSLDSPDLCAMTSITDKYAMGAFDKSDLWNQRRTCSTVWNKNGCHRGIRLRCINGSYDFCSGVVSADVNADTMAACVGFVNDHGDFHYILDKRKDGIIKTDFLGFRLEVFGDAGDVELSECEDGYFVTDGYIEINIKIPVWTFDGKEAAVRLDRDNKRIELIAYEGEEKTIDLSKINSTCGAFVLSIDRKCPEILCECVGGGCTLRIPSEGLCVSAGMSVCGFDEFMEF